MGYPTDLLSTRAIVKPGLWAVIPPTGLVNNIIPEIKGAKVSIICSPKLGAGFTQYIVEGTSGATGKELFSSEESVESFIYVISGTVSITVGEKKAEFVEGGYVYAPNFESISFEVLSEKAKLLLYKQVYIPYKDLKPYVVTGNINDIEYKIYDDMENVFIKDFLPTDDLAFDMNMHILSFKPGGCHPFVETHIQEHGMYILQGEGMYLLEDSWMGIKKDDFIWMGAFCQQAAYGVGTEDFTYIYSKDCNRDVLM